MKVKIWDNSINNWYDITPWIAFQGLSFSRNDVDGPNAGRDMRGMMHRDRVSIKEKININTIPLTRVQMKKLQALLEPQSFNVQIDPYTVNNGPAVLHMYSNNVKASYLIHRASGEDLQSVTFPLVEM